MDRVTSPVRTSTSSLAKDFRELMDREPVFEWREDD